MVSAPSAWRPATSPRSWQPRVPRELPLAEKLALLLRVHQEEREREGWWENFVVLGRSKSSWKTLFILFRNETVDVEDIVTRLKRHCDVLAVPVTVTDRVGIWTGE